MENIKAPVELNIYMARKRLTPRYRVWLLCRHLAGGRNHVELDALRAFVARHELFSRQTLENVLRDGRGVFWHLDKRGGRVFYAGVRRLYRHFAVAYQNRRPVGIPIGAFASIGELRAHLQASFVAEKPRTIGQAKLARMMGCTRRTVQRRFKAAGVTVRHNALRTTLDPYAPPTCAPADGFYYRAIVPALQDEHGQWERGAYLNRQGRMVRLALLRVLPNTYSLPGADLYAKGQLKGFALTSSARAAAHHSGGQSPVAHDASHRGFTEGAPTRLFWDDAKAAARAIEAMRPGETVFAAGEYRDGRGSQVWHAYTRFEGALATPIALFVDERC